MAGTLTIATLSDGTNSTSSTNCIQGSAKAWVRYNSSTSTTLGSHNISSVTYVSTGIQNINFTTAMPNANYSAVALCQSSGVVTVLVPDVNGTPTTTTFAFRTINSSASTPTNTPFVSIAFFD